MGHRMQTASVSVLLIAFGGIGPNALARDVNRVRMLLDGHWIKIGVQTLTGFWQEAE